MAKVKNNPLTEGISGRIGKHLVFRHLRDGRTVVATRPDFSNRVFSPEQRTHQSRFQQASAYAKVAAKTQPIYAELAQHTRQPAYNIALSDWFHAPLIHVVTYLAGCIRVHATDNVQVTRVMVTVTDEAGTILEQGEACPLNEDWWEYRPSTQGKVSVEAFDLAGNRTRQDI